MSKEIGSDSSIRQIALICFAAVAYPFLYYLSQKTDLEQHARNAQTLQNLKHWDSILKRDVLRTRTGMLNHYDTLVSTMKALKAAHARISENPNALPEDNGGYFQKSVETLGKNLTSRALDLERFKMRNAICGIPFLTFRWLPDADRAPLENSGKHQASR